MSSPSVVIRYRSSRIFSELRFRFCWLRTHPKYFWLRPKSAASVRVSGRSTPAVSGRKEALNKIEVFMKVVKREPNYFYQSWVKIQDTLVWNYYCVFSKYWVLNKLHRSGNLHVTNSQYFLHLKWRFAERLNFHFKAIRSL